MTFTMAKSIAGHDKTEVYVVIREDGDAVYLANGKNRTVTSPKRKKLKHVQLIKNIPAEVSAVSEKENDFNDLWIKRVISIYTKSLSTKE
ncbi:MAG: KOW domain-containing RNA-binding protein [Lachnospiraceae bacterium]|jgi:ribosomal protein L14E/L6E/L27E|nr:KOW domain-containing RNA-binding protein [Lachnospiraceae bacterium]MDD5956366.1 KOW domain-containing RNA-binding protein [Lachnospiraceae bacterium]